MGKKKRKRKKSKGVIWAEYAAFRILLALLQGLSFREGLALCRAAGKLLYKIDKRHRKIALENLRVAYGPSLSSVKAQQIVREVYVNLVSLAAEMAYLPRVARRPDWRDFFEIDEKDVALLEQIAKTKSGAIFITGHVGNWEVLGSMMARLGYPFHSVARPLDNPVLDAELTRFRELLGQKTIERRGALRKLVGVLRSGGYLAFLVDQDARKDGIFVRFFGRLASTHHAPASLAVRMRVPIIVGFAWRIGPGYRFRMFASKVIRPNPHADRAQEIHRVTQAYTAAIEEVVREHPSRWLWLHRRWKTRPPEERP